MNPDHVKRNSSIISKGIRGWGKDNFASYPWRFTDDKWLSLVAEIMLQRTRASSVVPVWCEFAQKFPSPELLIGVTEDDIRLIMGPLGLAWRAPLILKLAEALIELGGIPEDKDMLKALPGIGDYAASAVLSFKMNKRAVIIDSNVVRWVCRMTGSEYHGEVRRQNWLKEVVDVMTPARVYKDFNYALLDFTMTVCAKKPLCSKCPVSQHCFYYADMKQK